MTKTEHLQFVILMIPTFLILAAAAVSMADLEIPSPQPVTAVAHYIMTGEALWDESAGE